MNTFHCIPFPSLKPVICKLSLVMQRGVHSSQLWYRLPGLTKPHNLSRFLTVYLQYLVWICVQFWTMPQAWKLTDLWLWHTLWNLQMAHFWVYHVNQKHVFSKVLQTPASLKRASSLLLMLVAYIRVWLVSSFHDCEDNSHREDPMVTTEIQQGSILLSTWHSCAFCSNVYMCNI